ncbi:hypothetical protein NUW54_g9980 [Trametes sanguinea]|uniref:Uncharacterized protein n=1 Tax=Trametes sanguinea TaxID=158606 RepID=A0ACC1P3L4_9APHY|nr:hypothetical protein NUW54_g9980 [Trametes sanguinea]
MRYQQSEILDGHSGGVVAISFSGDGRYVATAGTDRLLCIWDVQSGLKLHSLTTDTPILSVAWLPYDREDIVCGAEDGSISLLEIGKTSIKITGSWAHTCPVERLAVEDCRSSRIASGAHDELFVWATVQGQWDRQAVLPRPANNLDSKDRDIVVTSIHWATSVPNLLATYLYHGVVVYDAFTWAPIRAFPVNGVIVDASLRPGDAEIALSNATSGFDVYSLRSGSPQYFLPIEVRQRRSVPVLFIHGGNALVAGSTTGKIVLWDINTRRRHQTLSFPGGDNILAIAVSINRFIIAAGGMGPNTPIVLWKAEEGRRRREGSAEPSYMGASLLTAMLCLIFVLAVGQYLHTNDGIIDAAKRRLV